jgi:KUP system potassium uptake protein
LGVVFGDIGTSPLYTVQTLFDPSDPHPVKVSHDSIFGVVSLIFWSVTIIVTDSGDGRCGPCWPAAGC